MTNVFEMNTEATTPSTTTEVKRHAKTKADKLASIDHRIEYHEGHYKKLEVQKAKAMSEFDSKMAKALSQLDTLRAERKRVEAEEELTQSEKVARGMAKRKAMLDALRAKQASGEALTPEEQETLDKATSAAKKRAEASVRARQARKAAMEAIRVKIVNGETLTPEETELLFRNFK